MPNRSENSAQYRFGFNGKEKDDEVKGQGAQYDYGFRIYDPRIAKFLSVDPLTASYPWYTPYQFAGNKPIWAVDLDGLEEYLYINIITHKNGKSEIIVTDGGDVKKRPTNFIIRKWEPDSDGNYIVSSRPISRKDFYKFAKLLNKDEDLPNRNPAELWVDYTMGDADPKVPPGENTDIPAVPQDDNEDERYYKNKGPQYGPRIPGFPDVSEANQRDLKYSESSDTVVNKNGDQIIHNERLLTGSDEDGSNIRIHQYEVKVNDTTTIYQEKNSLTDLDSNYTIYE
jgi:RHS repeat-associated protein